MYSLLVLLLRFANTKDKADNVWTEIFEKFEAAIETGLVPETDRRYDVLFMFTYISCSKGLCVYFV